MAPDLSVDLRSESGVAFRFQPGHAVRLHGDFVQECRRQVKPMDGDQRSHATEAQADLIRRT